MVEVTIEVGKQYVYDHDPYQILLVTVLEDVSDGDLIGCCASTKYLAV